MARRALATALLLACAAGAATQPPYSIVPIPPAEKALPTTIADRPIVVPGVTMDLEGPVFLPNGDLLFPDVQGGRVLRLDRRGRVTPVVKLPGLMPGGMALGPDGRVFVAAANDKGGGAIVAMAIDGTQQTMIVAESAGLTPNDIVFVARGGFYFTDARGSIGEATGGVWYVAPGSAPVPVVRHLAVANGIALSPDGKRLWIGEFALGRLYRIDLKDATTPAPFGAVTAYHFTGPAPYSMRVDTQGRVYVCLYGQGRILIFSPTGLPVAQIVLPDRDAGQNLHLTSLAIQPATGEIEIVSSDGAEENAGMIFRAHVP
ncbi:SMP-30/gluconolactonase/LRE family protein [Sphingomonas sp. AP4-R1]|uniref:SMP-30/gluconolactonase/LRE family protein n=1 Tax=Sphingomonas sp. AP4-R1 TaxID=2735134 RepID=UPI0014938414|nr:SMP-30/gluconolactonase/LRE family protein [Sphingomonas sp. AP4-R1]QJU58228.1 SMP-30/gluconolactonase/LRE family protein [Sphingomonas sp. AP4-R1]